MLIYCVQSASDLEGSAGYSSGLLEAGHPKILVSFLDYMGKQQTMFRDPGKPPRQGKKVVSRRKTLHVQK